MREYAGRYRRDFLKLAFAVLSLDAIGIANEVGP
jgi:hypothetical protein